MIKTQGRIFIDIERCKGCGLCILECPLKILVLDRKINTKSYEYVQITKPNECIGCANCGYVCPDNCITVYKIKNNMENSSI
ncbi:MAG: 4Fe-4S dicluster domain-containing protein [Bacteroidales bacterium OttesenSCG-928-I14]|jgi:2-oxoglutarate ferredoxin oxidoreductase subunit delta|nr:4Fe-4S dicluster domain-containing protein [Bacteroidales bacterium OttesenSCG-928-I14]